MEQTIAFGMAAIAVALAALLAARRRPNRPPLVAARLGPRWAAPARAGGAPAIDPAVRALRADEVARRTGLDVPTVRVVLAVWDEYLAALGLVTLPPEQGYLVYDPYLPPVTELGPDGPIPDRQRVAADVAGRVMITQSQAMAVLRADAELAERDTLSDR